MIMIIIIVTNEIITLMKIITQIIILILVTWIRSISVF